MAVQIVKVAVPSPLQRKFDYILANPSKLLPGMRVRIPFGQRKVIGIVLGFAAESKFESKLREIEEILDAEPLLDEELLNLLLWASQYYQYPIGEVLQQALPTLLRQGKAAVLNQETCWQLTTVGANTLLKRAPKQQALLDYIRAYPNGIDEQTLRAAGFTKNLWLNLAEKSYLKSFTQDPTLTTEKFFQSGNTTENNILLNEEQQNAVDKITGALNTFQCFLLEGVTGSGKTEIYLKSIEAVLKQNQQALVLVPEIALTPQMLARFQTRFNTMVGCLHSNLSDKERLKNWLLAKSGKLRIIIGTRSAIFTPLPALGLIIIDEEHDQSLKQQDNFRYSARDVAIRRAQQASIPIVLGSATPSLESVHNVKNNRYTLLKLSQRAGVAKKPVFHIIDLRQQYLQAGLTPEAIKKIREHLAAGTQVLLFLNRRGFATALFCHECAWIMACPRCDLPYVIHQETNSLHCHHCETRKKIPQFCGNCHSQQLIKLGIGTERVETELTTVFKDYDIVRIDRDSTRLKGSMRSKLEHIHQGTHQLLIGTQMLAKGHHFPNLTLVVVLNADQGLLSTDFRGTEKLGQLLIQVAGRAGRGEKQGEVLIQTHQPHHPLLKTLILGNYDEFAAELLLARQAANLPPYSYLILLRAESSKEIATRIFLNEVKNLSKELNTDVFVSNPVPAPLPKRAGKFRTQLLFQSSNRKNLQSLMTALRPLLENLKSARQVRWSIDVNPQEV